MSKTVNGLITSMNLILTYQICHRITTQKHEQHSTQMSVVLLCCYSGLFCKTSWVRQHQKGKPFWVLVKQEMMGWQWH